MSKHNIILTIRDRHVQDSDEDSSELITTGVFEGTENDFRITYAEQDEALKSCQTTLHVEGDDRITMVRTGESTAELILETHKRHNCHYTTPYGSFMLGVYAKQISSKVLPQEGCGALAFRYTLDFNAANSTENELHILFKNQKSEDKPCPSLSNKSVRTSVKRS